MACFRSTNSGGSWQKTNNGLPALYESALAINDNGEIFLGADFVNGAGGVYRSTDDGDNWVEINHGVIQTDVRALAINANGHIFAGTYFGGGVFRSTDNGDSWTPVNKVWTAETFGLWRFTRLGQSSRELQDVEPEYIVRLTTETVGRLLTQVLTSTDVAALAITQQWRNIFAGTRSIMGQGGGMFRSTDNGDTWTEQNTGFAALDVNAVVLNDGWSHLCRYRGRCLPV